MKKTIKQEEKNYFKAQYLYDMLSHLQGEILTTIDASFGDKEQREAVKSLVRNQFNDKFTWVVNASICDPYEGSANIEDSTLVPIK